MALTPTEIGLRCHDVHQGMSNVDPRSAHIARLETTRLIGMAANLAVNLRGLDVVDDPEALKQIAAQELGVESLAFTSVVEILEEAGMVRVRRVGRSKTVLDENVPYHQDLYELLGDIWEQRAPDEIERETVGLVNALAEAPRELDLVRAEIAAADLRPILAVGESTQLVKTLKLSDGTQLLYSPFFVFENPDVMREIYENHEIEEVRDVMTALRGEQGLLVDESNPVMNDMLARGLLLAPTIKGAGGDASFAFLPYVADREYLGIKKAVLEKAVQILACVRYGEHRAVATRIQVPGAILRKLLDPAANFTIKPHSEHRRQYYTLYRLQIVDFIQSGNWVAVKLIDTDDNKEAVRLALDLLMYQENVSTRGLDEEARELLAHGDQYTNAMATIRDRRSQVRLEADDWAVLAKAMRGGAILG